MINTNDILETINMIENENFDVRTITMGISLLDCIDDNIDKACDKVYDKICRYAGELVKTGEDISIDYGIPIIHKRISVTPIAMVASACQAQKTVKFAQTLDRAAKEVGVNFIGGYTALCHKGFSAGDYALIESIPEALSVTDRVCSSVNIGSTKAGINMDAVAMMGRTIRKTAELTADRDCIGAAKLVVFCNAPEDNPFMAGAFHGPGEPDCVINVGVSGPGVVRAARDAGAYDCWRSVYVSGVPQPVCGTCHGYGTGRNQPVWISASPRESPRTETMYAMECKNQLYQGSAGRRI